MLLEPIFDLERSLYNPIINGQKSVRVKANGIWYTRYPSENIDPTWISDKGTPVFKAPLWYALEQFILKQI